MEEVDVARLRHLRPRHYGRMTAVVVTLLLLALLVDAFARGKIDWSTTREYLFWPTILQGLVNTIWVSIACMVIGIIIGVLCAVARGSPNPVLRSAALFYAWFFRGTPVILQLLIWFNLALVFPRIGIPGLIDFRTVDVITPAVATLLGLGLNEGAYVSEIVRAGLLSVDRGQYEASKSIGMSYWLSLRRIILPQAMKAILPGMSNDVISMIKGTSIASVIFVNELTFRAEQIVGQNFQFFTVFSAAAVIYLVIKLSVA